ncbi:hypothetical protein CHARACLAT_020905 [Characodon lateralis]|uniref:Uncharacterized protein n=1 Tax=Characodon lateralis TaxID=208331 RepID=A0ABU7EW04_9TELE|nr:hypothetical protein [Characodon lateralis]
MTGISHPHDPKCNVTENNRDNRGRVLSVSPPPDRKFRTRRLFQCHDTTSVSLMRSGSKLLASIVFLLPLEKLSR